MHWLRRLALLLVPACGLQAQDVILRLHHPPPGQLTYRDFWRAEIENRSGDTVRLYLHCDVYDSRQGTLFAASTEELRLSPGTSAIQLEDIALRDTWYVPGYDWFRNPDVQVPDGDYSCILAAMPPEPDSGEGSIRQGQRASFGAKVRQQRAPELISPKGGVVRDDYPLFVWSPPVLQRPETRVSYSSTLRITEVTAGQKPEHAMADNQVMFEDSGIVGGAFRYPVAAKSLVPGKQYAWQIEARAKDLFPAVPGGARKETTAFSEAASFTFLGGGPELRWGAVLESPHQGDSLSLDADLKVTTGIPGEKTCVFEWACEQEPAPRKWEMITTKRGQGNVFTGTWPTDYACCEGWRATWCPFLVRATIIGPEQGMAQAMTKVNVRTGQKKRKRKGCGCGG